MLDRNNQNIDDILTTLRSYEAHVDNNDPRDGSTSQKDILKGLIASLEATPS